MTSLTTPAAPKQRRQRPRLFKIRFVIEGLTYAVVPLRDLDPAVATKGYRVQRTDPAAKETSSYDVRLTPEGHVECECKGFLRWRHCKHVRTLVAAGMLPTPAPIPAEAPAPCQEGGQVDEEAKA